MFEDDLGKSSREMSEDENFLKSLASRCNGLMALVAVQSTMPCR